MGEWEGRVEFHWSGNEKAEYRARARVCVCLKKEEEEEEEEEWFDNDEFNKVISCFKKLCHLAFTLFLYYVSS